MENVMGVSKNIESSFVHRFRPLFSIEYCSKDIEKTSSDKDVAWHLMNKF
jgi:transposase